MRKPNLAQIIRNGETQALVNSRTKNAILELNSETERYGLSLSESQAKELVDVRNESLRDNSRVEIGLGAVGRIISEFASSQYITPENYAETICELTEVFYYVKSEAEDAISDDKLLAFMKKYFEKTCQGSLDLLRTRDLETLLGYINSGNRRRTLSKDDDYSQMDDLSYISSDEDGDNDE